MLENRGILIELGCADSSLAVLPADAPLGRIGLEENRNSPERR